MARICGMVAVSSVAHVRSLSCTPHAEPQPRERERGVDSCGHAPQDRAHCAARAGEYSRIYVRIFPRRGDGIVDTCDKIVGAVLIVLTASLVLLVLDLTLLIIHYLTHA